MLESLIARYGYLAVFVGTLLEGETVVVLGGFAAHRGLLELPGVMVAAFTGALVSDQTLFFLARRYGDRLLAHRPTWEPALARIRALLDRHSTAVIVGFRFLYGFRNVTPVALGMSRVPAMRFVVLNAIGAALWAVAVSLIGWVVGQAATQLIGHLERYEWAVMAAIAAAGAALWIARRAGARRRARSA